MKPLLRAAATGWQAGDTLFVYRNAQYALRYYTLCADCDPSAEDFPWPARIAPSSPREEQFAQALESVLPTVVVGSQTPGTDPLDDLDRLPARGRVWLLFAHVSSHDGLNAEALVLRELDRRGRLLEKRTEDGARLYLYRLG